MALRLFGTAPETSSEDMSVIDADPRRSAIATILLRAAGLAEIPDREVARAVKDAVREIVGLSRRPVFDKRREAQEQIETLQKLLCELATALERTDPSVLNNVQKAIFFEEHRVNARRFDMLGEVETPGRNSAPPPVRIADFYADMFRIGGALSKVEFEHRIDQKIWHKTRGDDPNWDARAVALSLGIFLRRVQGAPPSARVARKHGSRFSKALRALFDLEGIQADVESPGSWALGRLAEES